MEGVDYVLHHAAVTAVQRSVDDPGAAHTVNATATLNVLLATGVPVLPRHEAARAGDVKSSLASITKARDLVGYQPEVDLDEGLRRTIVQAA